MNDSYGGGTCDQNATLLPQSNSPHCFFRTSMGTNQENCKEEEASKVKQQSQRQNTPVQLRNGSNVEIDCKGQPQQYIPAKVNPAMSAERNSNPYYQPQTREGTLDSRLSLDTKLMQAQSRFAAAGAAAVAVAAHREVGAMQLGLI